VDGSVFTRQVGWTFVWRSEAVLPFIGLLLVGVLEDDAASSCFEWLPLQEDPGRFPVLF
jgi:hypothetical protein